MFHVSKFNFVEGFAVLWLRRFSLNRAMARLYNVDRILIIDNMLRNGAYHGKLNFCDFFFCETGHFDNVLY